MNPELFEANSGEQALVDLANKTYHTQVRAPGMAYHYLRSANVAEFETVLWLG